MDLKSHDKYLSNTKNIKDDKKKRLMFYTHLRLKEKILNSVFAILDEAKLASHISNSLTEYAYVSHLEIYPVNARSRKIYLKLFNLYLGALNVKMAGKVMDRYISYYKEDERIQQGMTTKIIDHHIKNKNTLEIANWIKILDVKKGGGHLNLSRSYSKKIIAILSKILFDKYRSLDLMGQKTAAISGLQSLYSNENYPRSIVAKSAFKISILFLELGKTKKSYKWLILSFKKFNKKERDTLLPKLLDISKSYSLLQDFTSAINTSLNIYKNECTKAGPEKVQAFFNLVQFSIIEKRYGFTTEIIDNAPKCSIHANEIEKAQISLIKNYAKYNLIQNFLESYKLLNGRPNLTEKLISTLVGMYWKSTIDGNLKLSQTIAMILENHLNNKWRSLPKNHVSSIKDIFAINELEKSFINFKEGETLTKSIFIEKLFNQKLSHFLHQLNKITHRAENLLKTGGININLGVYKVLEEIYYYAGTTIKRLRPKGIPKSIVNSFIKQMNLLGNKVIKKSKSYKKTR